MTAVVLWRRYGSALGVACPHCAAWHRIPRHPDASGYLHIEECPVCALPPVTVQLKDWRPWGAR